MERVVVACCLLLVACSAEVTTIDAPPAASDDDAGQPPKAPPPDDTPVLPPPGPVDLPCEGVSGQGRIAGETPLGTVDLPYLISGIEQPGAHACPTVWLRAAEGPEINDQDLRIELSAAFPHDGDFALPITLTDTYVSVYRGDELADVLAEVVVTRVDGMADTELAEEDWRASLEIRMVGPGWDIAGTAVDVPYCGWFPICL